MELSVLYFYMKYREIFTWKIVKVSRINVFKKYSELIFEYIVECLLISFQSLP